MAGLHEAELDWRDGATPESRQFGDIYFSPRDGLAESCYVFLSGIGAPECWMGRGHFAIGETGFGTGLNFLATWAAWSKSAAPGDRLHYLSVEGFPLAREDLRKALSVWPDLSEQSEKLIRSYPERHPGFHRLSFDDGRVTLTLLFGEAAEMLAQVEGRLDAWYLDGFAPSKNPQMWRPALFRQLARLSRPGARLATFTAAGQVRRDLAEAGFAMRKEAGFGHKRECLRGIYEGPEAAYGGKPWFAPMRQSAVSGPVAIVGGGVAGLALARRLRQAGLEATVFEQDRMGSVGSGNRVGLIQPRLTAADSLDGRFNATAYLHACRYFDDLSGGAVWAGPRGVVQVARDDEEAERFLRLVGEGRLPAAEIRAVTAEEASDLAGIPLSRSGLWFPSGGGVLPKDVLAACSRDIVIRQGCGVSGLQRTAQGWLLQDAAGKALYEAATVVLANGPFARDLHAIADLPLTANRGQVAHLAASDASRQLKLGLSFGNYVSPAVSDAAGAYHVSGASFGRWPGPLAGEEWRALCEDETTDITGQLQALSPAFADVEPRPDDIGRAALRATTPDHLPVVGQVHDGDFFEREYADLHHGRSEGRYGPAAYHAGLYAMTGLGSRGFQTAPLLAEMLVDLMLGLPMPVAHDVFEALHCGRYQIRRLRRRRGR